MPLLGVLLLLAGVAVSSGAAEHPSAEISNGLVTVKIHLPDPDKGYYRGTRFDWSGAIYSLTYKGHEYFGEWQKSDDPYLHDRITGPVEEYRTDNKGLGYDDSRPGGRFIRIGVGVCQKPKEDDYRWTHSYKVVDPGRWTITKGGNWIEFTHELAAGDLGYAYRYTKRLTLIPGKDEMVIDHFLANTGKKAIESSVYNHNFFVIDGQPTGPDFSVEFPFPLKADRDLKGYAEVEGNRLVYNKEIPQGEHIITLLDGYSKTAADHAFSIENRKTKAGVRMTADRALSKLQFWSPRTTLCPEPYINLSIPPGQSDRWALHYTFYTLD